MLYRTLTRTAVPVLLAAALGCGGDGSGGKSRSGGPDPAKVMTKNTDGAARSCVLQLVKDRLLAAQARRVEVGQPLDDASRALEMLQRDGAAATGGDAQAYQQALAKANDEFNKLNAKLGSLVAPLDKECRRLTELKMKIENGPGFKAWEVVSHDVEEPNEKTPDQRTSLIEVKPTDFTDVLGSETLKFRLFWRKSVQTLGFGKNKEFKILWDLRRAERVSAEKAEGN
jgi:hypothetical protein